MKRFGFKEFIKKEGRDAVVQRLLLVLSLFVFLALLSGIVYYMFALTSMKLNYDLEHALSSIILAIQDDSISVEKTMVDNDILGVGVYSRTGNLLFSAGETYSRLPLSLFDFQQRDPSTNTLSVYDKTSHTVEFIRLSKQAVIASRDSLLVPLSGEIIDFANIIYILFDASEYHNETLTCTLLTIIAYATTLIAFFFVLRFSEQNRKYKDMLQKQENLVNLGQAARTLTHEIKNPLSAITIQLALLKRQVAEENLKDIAVIENETKRVIQLTNKVSDYLRNPQGQPVVLDLKESIEALLPLFPYKIRWIETDVDLAPVYFDEDRLRSIFENLLKNAIEATVDENEPDVEVEIVSSRRSGMYTVYIRDRGCGIKEEDESKIFDPFFTTKIHGSGIGLAISTKFVSAAGGSLKLKKREGGGTVVEVSIPAYKGEEK